MGSTAGKANGESGEWAGEVIPLDELIMLLARFGMIVGLDASPDADKELQTAQLAHALVGPVAPSTRSDLLEPANRAFRFRCRSTPEADLGLFGDQVRVGRGVVGGAQVGAAHVAQAAALQRRHA